MSGRPTWNAAIGGEIQGGNRLMLRSRMTSAKSQPQHLTLKTRQPGQGTRDDVQDMDLKSELEVRERQHLEEIAKTDPGKWSGTIVPESVLASLKHSSAVPTGSSEGDSEQLAVDQEKNLDADDSDEEFGQHSDNDSDDSDDDSDDEAELMRELERIKKQRAEEAAKKEAEAAEAAEAVRTEAILKGNPLLNQDTSMLMKRRWDDDVVFKNQARTEPKLQKRFINDPTRNDFHKKFLEKYIW